MNDILENIDIDAMINALGETLFMTVVSLIFAVIIGLILGIAIYLTQEDSLYPNKPVNKVLNLIVNILRAIPYIILLMIIVPLTTALVGSMIGAKAALPSLILSSAPFYGRMVMIALNEVDSGTIEASKAMGASNFQIITKVLIPEAKPALISSVTVMAISLVGYTAMAGAIGAGGLGNLAYLYGMARNNNYIMYTATILILIIVFIIQIIGDYFVRKLDKR
ncbi:ABC transporter permease [Thomasclavelia spiroformis DSM 1552]|uniref:ABC transporter, permease protein n=1 Tax=Thomasclavelia spiroformis DSM 1552 TaxID=428126 RepID=B1C253_9FIRM|nr:methionine ABC transporter permease [Thomasclavelia spiroformis]EDS74995.1 ABC transporter, permease protein [Thomasclavelia spiroformis DSM 1552]UWO90718.1 ABC transporter permease [Thomasclavelia spiroformis DSM 1552]